MASDLISRNTVLSYLNDVWYSCKGTTSPFDAAVADALETIIKEVEYMKAVDAVEVVRCKDCMFFQPYEGEEHKGDCEELIGLESCVYEDDFCSYGCRMEE